ncbi:MAG: hypothetical protein ABWW69_05970 [Pyrodictiaceae archaeon]
MPPPDSLTPVSAQGFFSVDRAGLIYQVIVYHYYDPEEYYAGLIHKPLEYEEEMLRLYSVMQELLDSERVVVNNVRVRPEVYSVSLEHRGDPREPYITFIILFKAPLHSGRNVYENWYEDEVAEYDYEVYWVFPPGTRIIEVVTSSEYQLLGDDNILLLWARRGDRTGGYERIVFELP